MASPTRIVNIAEASIRVDYISTIGVVGGTTRVFYTSGYLTTTQTVSQLITLIPEIVTLTGTDGNSVYINALNVLDIGNTINSTRINLRSGAIDVTEDIDTVRDAINGALNLGQTTVEQVETSVDYTVLPKDDIIFVDTAGVTITIPADRTNQITIKNISDGNITVDPLTNTVEGEDTGLISFGSSWTLALNGTNWRLI